MTARNYYAVYQHLWNACWLIRFLDQNQLRKWEAKRQECLICLFFSLKNVIFQLMV